MKDYKTHYNFSKNKIIMFPCISFDSIYGFIVFFFKELLLGDGDIIAQELVPNNVEETV